MQTTDYFKLRAATVGTSLTWQNRRIFLCLFKPSCPVPTVDRSWADVQPHQCDFSGYSRSRLLPENFTAPQKDGEKWIVKSGPAVFRWAQEEPPKQGEAKYIGLIVLRETGTIDLLDLRELDPVLQFEDAGAVHYFQWVFEVGPCGEGNPPPPPPDTNFILHGGPDDRILVAGSSRLIYQ